MVDPSPTSALAGLEALWGRYRSSWRRLWSRGMVRELALRSSFDLDPLAPERIANTIPRGTIPDCEQCDDICCLGLENLVSLRLEDVARLVDRGRTDLMSRKKPRFPAALLTRKPWLKELIASELWLTLPVLRQVGERRICAALTPEVRCGLYPDWPLSCERFPYSYSELRRGVVWGRRCPSRTCEPRHAERSEALFAAAVDTYNARIRDAVLLAHARPELDGLGLGAWLIAPGEDPFEA